MQLDSRELTWDGCLNVRDLGGLPTADGNRTRWHALIRADLPNRLTSTGQHALYAYGVRTVIDLRGPRDVASEPCVYAAVGTAPHPITYVHQPIERYTPEVSAKIKQARHRADVYCTILDAYPAEIVAVLQTIAHAPAGGVLLHCHSGKDRTGMIVALVLDLAQVLPSAIIADYARSQECLRPEYDRLVAANGGVAPQDFWSQPTATAEMMEMFLRHLADVHGGAAAYARAHGVSEADLAAVLLRFWVTTPRVLAKMSLIPPES